MPRSEEGPPHITATLNFLFFLLCYLFSLFSFLSFLSFFFLLQVLIHEGINFDRELYFAILLDRAHNGPVIVASPQGGMDIEQVAHESPEKIFTQP